MKIQPFRQELFVSLGSEINVERFIQMSSNEQFEELYKPRNFIYFQVRSLVDAKKLCDNFIRSFNLCSSNWVGGRVLDKDNNFVAQISYNGRIWDNEDWKLAKEIETC